MWPFLPTWAINTSPVTWYVATILQTLFSWCLSIRLTRSTFLLAGRNEHIPSVSSYSRYLLKCRFQSGGLVGKHQGDISNKFTGNVDGQWTTLQQVLELWDWVTVHNVIFFLAKQRVDKVSPNAWWSYRKAITLKMLKKSERKNLATIPSGHHKWEFKHTGLHIRFQFLKCILSWVSLN